MPKRKLLTETCSDPTVEKGDTLESPEIFKMSLCFGGFAVITALIVIFMYVSTGDKFLEARYDSVGEVLMKRGDRLNAAGMYAEALEYYEKALRARYAGPQNRTHTLEAAGLILWEQERLDEALPHLTESLDGPKSSLRPYAAIVDILLQKSRHEEASRYLALWKSAIETVDNPEENAKLMFASGKAAELQGSIEEAVALYEKGDKEYVYPPFAAGLSQIHAQKGDRKKTLYYLERYFVLGGKGAKTTELRKLHLAMLSGKPFNNAYPDSLFQK